MKEGGIENPTTLEEDAVLSLQEMKAIVENNDCFADFAVSIFDYSLGNEVVLKINELPTKQINILLFDNYFKLIFLIRMVVFFFSSCENFVAGKMQHVCKRSVCPQCKCIANCIGELQKCPSCCRVFRGNEC